MSKESFTLEEIQHAWVFCGLSLEYFEEFILPAMRNQRDRVEFKRNLEVLAGPADPGGTYSEDREFYRKVALKLLEFINKGEDVK